MLAEFVRQYYTPIIASSATTGGDMVSATSREAMNARRATLVSSGKAVNPTTLREGDEFFVLDFSSDSGIALLYSGTYVGSTATKVTLRIDGEDIECSKVDFGFSARPGEHQKVIVRSLRGVTYDCDYRKALKAALLKGAG